MCVWHCGTYTNIDMYTYIYINIKKDRAEKYMMTTCVGFYVYIFVGVNMHTYMQINLSYVFLCILNYLSSSVQYVERQNTMIMMNYQQIISTYSSTS